MNTRDFIKLLQETDPRGDFEVSVAILKTAHWQTPSGATIMRGDTGARLILDLADSPPLPGSAAEQRAAAQKVSS